MTAKHSKSEEPEDDLQTVLANTRWSALLIPFALAIAVVIVTLIIVLRG